MHQFNRRLWRMFSHPEWWFWLVLFYSSVWFCLVQNPFHNFITVSHLENVKVQKYVFRFCLCACCGGGVVTEWAHQRLTPSMVILSSSSSLLPSLSLSSSGVATIGTSLNILPILVLFAIINVFKCLYLNRFTQLFAYISVYVGMFLCIFCILWKGSQICCTSLSCHPVWL